MRRITAFIVSLAACTAAFALPGDLDTTYGVNGVARVSLPESHDTFLASAVRDDGTILSWGFTVTGGVRTDVALTRHLPDGTLDTAFGNQGRARHLLPEGFESNGGWPFFFRQPGDRYVIALSCSNDSFPLGAPQTCLARFHGDGSLDTSFGVSGWQRLGILGSYLGVARPDGRIVLAWRDGSFIRVLQLTPEGNFDVPFGVGGVGSVAVTASSTDAMALLPDGRLLIAGGRNFNDGFVARVTASGSADPSFGLAGTGVAIVPFARTVTPLTDGKILVAGCTDKLARLDSFGDLDPTYGTGGTATIGLNACPGFATRLADGSIVMTQASQEPSTGDGLLAVLKTSETGVPDAGFGTGGIARVAVGGTKLFQQRVELHVLGDGSLLAGVPTHQDFGLVRLQPNGAPTATFGNNGLVATDLQGGRAIQIVGAGRDGNGRIVAIGPQFDRFRLLADGSRDPAYASSSPVPFYDVRGLAVQADGTALAWDVQTALHGLRRFNADGSPDLSFGTSGHALMPTDHFIGAATVQADGKLAIAGVVSQAFPSVRMGLLARREATGAVDTTFASGGARTVQIAPDGTSLSQLVVQPDGKWLSAGGGSDANGPRLAAARTVDGNYDPTFGFNGRFLSPAFTDLGGIGPTVRNVLLRPDGRSVIVASVDLPQSDYVTGNYCRRGFKVAYVGKIVMTALDAAGVMESTFGSDGRVSGFIGPDAMVQSAALDDAGRILVAGVRRLSLTGCSYAHFVARFTPDGRLDLGFGNQGVRDLDPGDGTSKATVFVNPNGNLRVLGVTTTSLDAPIATWQLLGGDSVPPSGPPGDADDDGIPDTVEAAVGHNPLLKDNDVFGDATLFAMQQYRDFLGREGDSSGINFWKSQVTAGTLTRAQVIESFFSSAEFQGTIAPVARLYFAYFMRIPDYPGLNFWIGQYRAGMPSATISQNFAASPEFAARYGALDNGAFVDLVYQNVLGRAADSGGRAFWKGQLDSGAQTRGQVMLGFSESDEYKLAIASEVYVTMMYNGMLRRAPDAGGFSFWVQYLDAGNSGLALINGFLGASEYRARFLP